MTASNLSPRLSRNAPVVRFRGIGRTYTGPPPVYALKRVDLTVDTGEYLSVIGPSGSGKSTFLNLLGMLDRPTDGVYELDGIDVGSLSEAERTALRARKIGFVFQSFHLLPYRTAAENVALGQMYVGVPRAARRRAALEVLERIGLGHRSQALPSTLSGGERQRVAIARALVNKPRLLLCDEPTGNLDTATAAKVLDVLDELRILGLTMIVITHDQSVARRADRTITIRDGSLQSTAGVAGGGHA